MESERASEEGVGLSLASLAKSLGTVNANPSRDTDGFSFELTVAGRTFLVVVTDEEGE